MIERDKVWSIFKRIYKTDIGRTQVLRNTFLLKAMLKMVRVAGREVILASAIKSNGNLTGKIRQLFDSH